MSTAPHLDRFIRAVHRRWVVVRALERVGLCTLAACAAGVLLVPILLWRGKPAMPVAVTMLCVGAAAGVVIGATRRPTRFAAAAEADRQLDLSDLLTSALAARAGADAGQPWARTVLAIADARCAALAPNHVVLHRLGGRAWGGIGLAAALVLTLGMMSTAPAPQARAARGPGERAQRVDRPSPNGRAMRATPAMSPHARNPRGSDGHDDQRFGPGRPDAATGADDAAGPVPRDATPTVASDPSGQGGGAGRTPDSTSHGDDVPVAPRVSTSHDPDAGDVTGAGGTGTARTGTPHGPAGATAGTDTSTSPAPPWSGASWPADRAAALEALRAGRVPPQYDGIVREYFKTDPE